MPRLTSDKKKCQNCGACEICLPTFKTEYDGDLYISWATMRDSVLAQESVKYVIAGCPHEAISLQNA